jgi:hypothetical protein
VNGPGRLTVSNGMTLFGGSTLRLQLNGTTAATQFDQVRVLGGNVALGLSAASRPTLDATLGFTSAVGDVFRFIDDTSVTTALLGQFSATLLTVSDQTFNISSTGGTGNDATLTHINTRSAFHDRSISTPIDEGSEAVLRGTIVDPDPLDTFFLEVTWGDGGATETFRFRPSDSRQVELRHTYTDNAAGGGAYAVHLLWRDRTTGRTPTT